MLHPMQHFLHVPFVQPQYAAHNAAHNSLFSLNYGMASPSTWNVHSTTNASKSFLVYFAPDEEATFLRRAKNLNLTSRDCRELTQEIVQGVNSHIACRKNMNAQRFLRAETTTEEQRKDILRAAASGSVAAAAVAVAAAAVPPQGKADPPDHAKHDSGGLATSDGNPTSGRRKRRPWGLVGNAERKKRIQAATAPFREVFWPGFRAAIAAFDDDGAPIGDNDLFAILFEY